jgi:hypothetical protein
MNTAFLLCVLKLNQPIRYIRLAFGFSMVVTGESSWVCPFMVMWVDNHPYPA